MLKKLTIISTIAILSLTGCDKEAPKCSDQEVIASVQKSFHTELVKYVHSTLYLKQGKTKLTIKEMLEDEEIQKEHPMLFAAHNLHMIKTIVLNDEGKYSCSAIVTSTNDKIGISYDTKVSYSIDTSDDGKEFHVKLDAYILYRYVAEAK